MSDPTDLLIRAVFKRRALWNQRNKDHHNGYILAKLWDQVAYEVKSTSKDVRNRWKNLRDKFRIELKKGVGNDANEDSLNSDETEQSGSTWQFFKSLTFLSDQFTVRQSCGNWDSTSRHPTDDRSVSPDVRNPTPSPTPSFTSNNSTRSLEGTSQKRNRYQHEEELGMKHVKLEVAELQSMREEMQEQPDKHTAFFSSLVPHINKLPDDKLMLLQMEIQQVVYKHVYGQIECSNPNEPLVSSNTHVYKYPSPGENATSHILGQL